MDIRSILMIMIGTVIAAIVSQGCHGLCTPAQFSLSGGLVSVYPEKDSILVGDTLWFSSSIPTILKYKHGGNADSGVFNLSGASNVATQVNFHAIPQIDTITEAVDSFTYMVGKGSFAPNPMTPHSAQTISFIELNNSYEFSFGIIAKKRGIYCLTIIDIYQAETKCANVSVAIKLKDTVLNHSHYLQAVYYPGSRYEQSISIYDQTHSYCFKVN